MPFLITFKIPGHFTGVWTKTVEVKMDVVSVQGFLSQNYYHYLLEYLPRFVVFHFCDSLHVF